MYVTGALPVSFFIMGLFWETVCSVSVEVEVGDDVTIWCGHEMSFTGYIYWFKHTCGAVPLLVGCNKFHTSAPSQPCHFFNKPERMVMFVEEEKTSLSITAVNVSDTGLYYCSSIQHNDITFNNTIYITVRGGNKTLSMNPVRETDSMNLIIVVNVVFGSLIVILLGVFILLKHRNTHRGQNAADMEDPDSSPVNYAAINFSTKKNKKNARGVKQTDTVDPSVFYASVRR